MMDTQKIYSPALYDYIEPLAKWKILNLENLHIAAWRKTSPSNFYKTFGRIKENGLVEDFQDNYSQRKYVYLSKKGREALGINYLIPLNKESLIHDSFSSENAFHFKDFPFTKEVLVDHEILQRYPLIGHRPDALVFGYHKKDFCMAMEMELTIKSKERILETFSYYHESGFFNNVLYIFGQERVYETYIRALENEGAHLNKSKFLFLYMKSMYRRYYDTFNSPCYHNGQTTTLGELFDIEQYKKSRWPGIEEKAGVKGVE